jgi:CD2 antigen cytoplasmic tail-binding protein 2
MSSRYSAARPNKAGEKFARTHHHEHDDAGPSKKPKFDIRNPSALAPDAPEEDTMLEADVIGGSSAWTKRGAVNLDGYDSDSDNEGFDMRAEERAKTKKGDVSITDAFDYAKQAKAAADDDDDDMWGEDDDEEESTEKTRGKWKKAVSFQEEDEIEKFSVLNSKSGGHISGNFALDPKGKLSTHAMDDQESSDNEDEAELAALEEGIDEEVGAGGLKKNAPKVDAFNMKSEQEEGRFDDAGNYGRLYLGFK